MIIVILASFVTCCMSINTADFLCQCNVHVFGIIVYMCFIFYFIIIIIHFPRCCLMSCYKPRATSMCTVMTGVLEMISLTLGGLLYSLWNQRPD